MPQPVARRVLRPINGGVRRSLGCRTRCELISSRIDRKFLPSTDHGFTSRTRQGFRGDAGDTAGGNESLRFYSALTANRTGYTTSRNRGADLENDSSTRATIRGSFAQEIHGRRKNLRAKSTFTAELLDQRDDESKTIEVRGLFYN